MCFVSRQVFEPCAHLVRQRDYQLHEGSTRHEIVGKNLFKRIGGESYDNCWRVGSKDCEDERRAPRRRLKWRGSHGQCEQCAYEGYKNEHLRITYRISKIEEHDLSDLLEDARKQRKKRRAKRARMQDVEIQRDDEPRLRTDEEAYVRESRYENEVGGGEATLERVPFQSGSTQYTRQRESRPRPLTPNPGCMTPGHDYGRQEAWYGSANTQPAANGPFELSGVSIPQELEQREPRSYSWPPGLGNTALWHRSDVEEMRTIYGPGRSHFEDDGDDDDELQGVDQDSPDHGSSTSSSKTIIRVSRSASPQSQPSSGSRLILKRSILKRASNPDKGVRFDLSKNEERIISSEEDVYDDDIDDYSHGGNWAG